MNLSRENSGIYVVNIKTLAEISRSILIFIIARKSANKESNTQLAAKVFSCF